MWGCEDLHGGGHRVRLGGPVGGPPHHPTSLRPLPKPPGAQASTLPVVSAPVGGTGGGGRLGLIPGRGGAEGMGLEVAQAAPWVCPCRGSGSLEESLWRGTRSTRGRGGGREGTGRQGRALPTGCTPFAGAGLLLRSVPSTTPEPRGEARSSGRTDAPALLHGHTVPTSFPAVRASCVPSCLVLETLYV